jgi:hypothetical protein
MYGHTVTRAMTNTIVVEKSIKNIFRAREIFLALLLLCAWVSSPVFAADATVPSVESLSAQLKNATNPRLKMQLIEALTLRQSSTTLAAVVSMLNDKNPQVRQCALINLAYFGVNTAAIERIRATLETETDENAQLAGLNTLAVYKTTASVAAIDAAITRKNAPARVKDSAYRLLEKNGSKDSQDRLKKHAKPKGKKQ